MIPRHTHRHEATAPAPGHGILLELAHRVEPDANRVAHWWNGTGIAEFGNQTPDQLVRAGWGDALERFLRSILRGERD